MDAKGLAINLATIRQQYELPEAIDACLARGITAVAPWRDQIAKLGIGEATRLFRDSGISVTGLCRGGMFTTDPDALDDNKRAIDEAAAIGAGCLVLVVGGLPPAHATSPPHDRSLPMDLPRCCRMRAPATCRWRSNRCIPCMRPTGPA